jgi:hypothetical protein
MVSLTQFGNLFIISQCSCNSILVMVAKATRTCRWLKIYVKSILPVCICWLFVVNNVTEFFGAIISKPIDKFQTLSKLLNILHQWLQLPIDSCCNQNSTASYANQVGFFGEDPIFLDSTNFFVFSPERPLRLSFFSQLQ